MSGDSRCETCGGPLSADILGGKCPSCLLELELDSESRDISDPEPLFLSSGQKIGPYEIRSLLGTGGMGEVYRAHDTRLDRDVALKTLPARFGTDPKVLRRFEREAKAVAALSHPNILAIHDFGTEQGMSYAVMELLDGETLREYINRTSLPARQTAEIGIAVAAGLAAAHAKGFIHRDLKPENIFLTSDGQVKILDFGIARVRAPLPGNAIHRRSTYATQPGTIMGTIGYMSPEQVRGEEAEAPSDIFALGCVLYEMLTRHGAFARATTAETLAAILRDDVPVLPEAKEIPPALDRVIRRCLEKSPKDRFQSARELSLALKDALRGLEPQANVAARDVHPALSRVGPTQAVNRRAPRFRLATWFWISVAVLLVGISGWYVLTMRIQPIDSLAVLPLVNASDDPQAEYLSDGLTEGLINTFSELPQLKRVIALSTVSGYKGKQVDPRTVGKELGVRAVLMGKVTQRGADVIVTPELINAADGARLWGERYSHNMVDVMTLQGRIARRVSEKLRIALTEAQRNRLEQRHTENGEAYKLYLKGRYYLNKTSVEDAKKALEFFKQAIDLDPNFALPYTGQSEFYLNLSNRLLSPDEALPKARAAAMKALELDENLAEAYVALGVLNINNWNWAASEDAFKRAIELNPGYAYAHNLFGLLQINLSQFAQADIEMKRAQELDPLSPFVQVGVAWAAYFSRRYDDAITQLLKTVEWNSDFGNAHMNLGWVYTQKKMFREAVAELTKAIELTHLPWESASLGYTYAVSGRTEEAQKILKQLEERGKREQVPPYCFALIHAGLGNKDHALDWLQKGYEMKDDLLGLVKVDPMLDSLHSDSRFTDLVRRLNLN